MIDPRLLDMLLTVAVRAIPLWLGTAFILMAGYIAWHS